MANENHGVLTLEARIKFTLDYFDKEITAMGWLAGIAAAVAGAGISQPLFKDNGMGDVRLGSLLTKYPESALMLIGCALLIGSAVCFLAQRLKLTTRYGQACSLLLSEKDPIQLLNGLISWRSWRLYKWGRDLLGIGMTQTAVGLILLNWRIAQQNVSMTRTRSILTATGVPLALLTALHAARAIRRKMYTL